MIADSTRETIDGWMYGTGSGGYISREAPTYTPSTASTSGAPAGMLAAAAVPPPTLQQPSSSSSQWANLAANTISQPELATRTIDPKTETVSGQMQTLMSENSPLLQQAKSDAMRTANERGMLNSTMAATGGTDAMLRSALQVATPDAAQYAHAADYNTAATNQAVMYNADQRNQTDRLKTQMRAEEEGRLQQRYLAEMQDSTSRYNTDTGYRQQVDANRKSMANNIIQNMDMSPDRKAALLEELGEGRRAGYDTNGTYVPGYGLAGAIYVIDSVSSDLNFSNGAGQGAYPTYGNGSSEAVNGAISSVIDQRNAQLEQEDRSNWGRGRMTNSSDDYYYRS